MYEDCAGGGGRCGDWVKAGAEVEGEETVMAERSQAWIDHDHEFITTTITRDHYYDYDVKFCVTCDAEAGKSGIPSNKHFEHPKGCKCYWCVWCDCDKLRQREAVRV